MGQVLKNCTTFRPEEDPAGLKRRTINENFQHLAHRGSLFKLHVLEPPVNPYCELVVVPST